MHACSNAMSRSTRWIRCSPGLRRAPGGRCLVSGEAGIGKTSLVECFLERHHAEIRVLWGACEALFTPRPLGPLYDIAQQAQTPLRALLEGDASRATLFAAVLDELVDGALPTVVVVEDIHWADEATLDLIKFLARRIHRTRTLLILTYRDDELSKEHPLRQVLGDLPARDVTRLPLLAALGGRRCHPRPAVRATRQAVVRHHRRQPVLPQRGARQRCARRAHERV